MAVWSEIRREQLAAHMRLDAEYYDPALLRLEDSVKSFSGGWAKLADLSDLITDGDHLKRNYVEDGVLFLTSENFAEHQISFHSELRISPNYEKTLARARSEPESVFLTKTGKWYGKAAVCPNDAPHFNISADVAKIRLKDDYDPYFLACYLNSPIGYALVRRESTGGSRDRIVLDNLRSLPVPIVNRSNTAFRNIVEAIAKTCRDSELRETEAESLLESALGLDKLDLTPRLFYEVDYADVADAGRFDAEYFNPREQNLITALSRDGLTLADVAMLATRRFRPKKGVDFRYIEIGGMTGNGTAESNPIVGEDAPSRAQGVVRTGDVITSTVRPIRRLSAIIMPEQDGFVCSSGFAVLTPKDIEPELLLAYLRLPLVCELLDLHTTASMYPAISTSDLMQIPISLPDDTTGKQIVAKVRESFNARREARRLLDEAKALVEKAILED